MNKLCAAIIAIVIVLTLVAGCGGAETTDTPPRATETAFPPTDTPPPPTATDVPPTPTSKPLPTDTPAPTATPHIEIEKVSFITDDNLALSGTLFGQGEIAVILAHQGTQGTNQTSWRSFARSIAGKGFAALTFDFRGYGKSEGPTRQSWLERDVRAAIAFLHERGFNRIACIGACMGGTACLRAAVDADLEGLVVIASPMSIGYPTRVLYEDLEALTMSKLYVCAENDRFPNMARQIKNMYEHSSEPRQLKLFPGTAHGTELFDTPYRDELSGLLVDFLERLRSIAETPPASTPPSRDAGDVRITIVYDNNPYDLRLKTEWGFAAWVEYGGHTLLFDTGGNGATLLGNMARLGLDPQAIEAVVLSHIHGDHVDGLGGLLSTGVKPTVYVPAAFPDAFKNDVRARTDLVEVTEPLEIFPGVHSTGAFPADIIEQAVMLGTQEGVVVITGCAHPGIVRMVRRAKEITGDEIALVLGGFHLGGYSQGLIRTIIADFRELGVKQVSPMHCTGDDAIAMFADEYGDDYVQGGVGRVIDVEPVAPADTPEPTATVTPPPPASDGGGVIAFVSERGGAAAIYTLNVADALQGTDGSEPRRLTDHLARDLMPVWQPISPGDE